MAGYTRQDTNDNIATGKVINASDFDNEYNAIQTAFNASTGHKHDGTAAEGARITVIGPSGKFSTDANAFFPTNTATVGLGKTSFVFKDLHIDNIVADGNTISTITSGNLIVDPYTYKLEVKGGTTGGSTSGMIQLNCENNSHGQTIQAQPHSAGVTNKMLLPAGADSTLVSLVSTDTLTNKTLTTATLTTPVFSGISTTASGNLQVKPATSILEVQGDGNSVEGQIKLNCHVNSHGQTIKAQPHGTSTTNTMLLPQGASSTLVSRVSVDTLTNKTLTSPVLNTGVSGDAIKDEDDMASNSATHLATQQSIKAYVDAEISGISADITEVTAGTGLTGGGTSGAVTLNVIGGTGITANANDIAIDGTVATLTGSQTLTNKVLTNPTITEIHTGGAKRLKFDNYSDEFINISGGGSGNYTDVTFTSTDTSAPTVRINASNGTSNTGTIELPQNLRIGGSNVTATGTELSYNDLPGSIGLSWASKTMVIDANGDFHLQGEFTANSYNERLVSNTSATGNVTIDLESGNTFAHTLTGNVTYTFSNPPSTNAQSSASQSYGFTLKIKQDGTGSRSITWPNSIDWAGGSAPTLTGTANSVDVFTFFTHDAGTTYYGFTAGLNLS
tara:strand:- start:1408 stop:3261 length:1854 start_codon:yes stop_codon:yes gene_type:complete